MLLDFIFIFVISYIVILYKKYITPDVGADRYPFSNILLCKEKKLYAPFKYRPLGYWIAELFNVGGKRVNKLVLWAERYYHNVYIDENKEIDKYYALQYFLLLFTNLSFYWYLSVLNLNSIIGILLLNLFVLLTFFHDAFDNFLEIAFFALFLGGVLTGVNPLFLLVISLLATLNRETSVFMILIALFYTSIIGILATVMGFVIGFVIPRIMYKDPVDDYDKMYYSGFKFLTFNPIKNWTRSIWPHLKQRFLGITSEFYVFYKGEQLLPSFEGRAFSVFTKDIVFNRLFLFVGLFLIFLFSTIASWGALPDNLHNLIWIFWLFIISISLPGDVREIRIYSPAFCILIPCLLYL